MEEHLLYLSKHDSDIIFLHRTVNNLALTYLPDYFINQDNKYTNEYFMYLSSLYIKSIANPNLSTAENILNWILNISDTSHDSITKILKNIDCSLISTDDNNLLLEYNSLDIHQDIINETPTLYEGYYNYIRNLKLLLTKLEDNYIPNILESVEILEDIIKKKYELDHIYTIINKKGLSGFLREEQQVKITNEVIELFNTWNLHYDNISCILSKSEKNRYFVMGGDLLDRLYNSLTHKPKYFEKTCYAAEA